MPDTSEDRLVAAVHLLLAERGPSKAGELIDALTEAGIAMPPDPADALGELLENDIAPVLPLADGRWVWLPTLLDGRMFTHRLTRLEAGDHEPRPAPEGAGTELTQAWQCAPPPTPVDCDAYLRSGLP